MKDTIISKVSLYLPPLIWALLIFNFSSGKVPVASSVYWQDFAVKKSGHVLLFGMLAILIYRALIGDGVNKKKAAIWSIFLATFYGATDEYHQMFTQGREARIRDVLFDGMGAGVFVFVVYRFLAKLPPKTRAFLLKLGLE